MEENGSESCELATNSSFVLVRIPVRIVGDDEKGEAIFHYSMGSFAGRDTALALGGRPHHPALSYPAGALWPRERLAVEVLAGSDFGPQKSCGPSAGGRLARQRPSPRANTRLGQKGQNLPTVARPSSSARSSSRPRVPARVSHTGGVLRAYTRDDFRISRGALIPTRRPGWRERWEASFARSGPGAPRYRRCAGPRP